MPPALSDLLTAQQPFVLLEDRLANTAAATLYADPVEIIRCEEAADVEASLQRIEAGLAQGLHAAGFFGYELGYALQERLVASMPAGRTLPLLWFGLFREPTRIASPELDAFFGALAPPPPLGDALPRLDADGHAARVARILDYLREGDAYQVNLTFPIDFRYDGDPLALYAALRASQPVSHGGLVRFDEATILSVSPELFLDIDKGRATTRPMKGTVPRRDTPEADERAKAQLSADPKQRAENLMIVDLLRNDLSRISEVGSVEVSNLFNVETYPTFHAMASTVTSRLLPGTSLRDLIPAVFPCGSITGAPKLRAMQIIRELENAPREVYTGSIGALSPSGDLRLNVAIRTATLLPDGTGRYDVGSGIVADSEASAEYAECLLKARVPHRPRRGLRPDRNAALVARNRLRTVRLASGAPRKIGRGARFPPRPHRNRSSFRNARRNASRRRRAPHSTRTAPQRRVRPDRARARTRAGSPGQHPLRQPAC